MQVRKKKGCASGHLQEPQTQAEAGMIRKLKIKNKK
jgi:hypothetical protein